MLSSFSPSTASLVQSSIWLLKLPSNDTSYDYLMRSISYSGRSDADFFCQYSLSILLSNVSLKAPVKHWNRRFWHHPFSLSCLDYLSWCKLCGAVRKQIKKQTNKQSFSDPLRYRPKKTLQNSTAFPKLFFSFVVHSSSIS